MIPLSPTAIKFFIASAVTVILLGGVYYLGYTNAEDEYTLILNEQKSKIEILEAREEKINTVIVTEYKDKIVYVTKVEEKIKEVTRDVLGPEVNRCDIGPGFISLHNAAANNKAIPTSTSSIDDGTSPIE